MNSVNPDWKKSKYKIKFFIDIGNTSVSTTKAYLKAFKKGPKKRWTKADGEIFRTVK